MLPADNSAFLRIQFFFYVVYTLRIQYSGLFHAFYREKNAKNAKINKKCENAKNGKKNAKNKINKN